MMYLRALLLLVLLTAFADDGSKDGRRGNGLYNIGEYEDAITQYQTGLAQYEGEVSGPVPAGLANNLGMALHRVGRYDEALAAFTQSALLANASSDLTRAAYNTGNNAVTLGDLEMALAAYREALLTDPTNEDAKFNYEFIKRKLDEQQQQQQGDNQNQDQNQDQQGNDEQQDDQGEQNEDGEQQQDQQGEDEQQDQQGNQDQQEQDEEEQEQQNPQPDESGEEEEQLSREQAERILQALQDDEEQLLRQVQKMKGRPRRVEKDW